MYETDSDTIFRRVLDFINMSDSDIDFSPALATGILFFLFRMLDITDMYATEVGTSAPLVTVIFFRMLDIVNMYETDIGTGSALVTVIFFPFPGC